MIHQVWKQSPRRLTHADFFLPGGDADTAVEGDRDVGDGDGCEDRIGTGPPQARA